MPISAGTTSTSTKTHCPESRCGRVTCLPSGQDHKRVGVIRAHDAEVSTIECHRNRGFAESFRDCDDTRVGATKRHVCVFSHQLGCAMPVTGSQRLDVEFAIGDGAEEARLRL